MVRSLLRHLMGRYGEEEVIQWPIEVWNEPNLCGFWENADMQEYFKLFHRTFDAIKEVNPGSVSYTHLDVYKRQTYPAQLGVVYRIIKTQ